MEGPPRLEQLIQIIEQYTGRVDTLNKTGVLTLLPRSESFGVLGIDGKEYPIPTPEEFKKIIQANAELIEQKVAQGFDRLELTPMAMPISLLIDRLKAAVLKHATEGKIYRTRRTPSDPLTPVNVDMEQPVWILDILKRVLDTGELVYFPQNYSKLHGGQTKKQVIDNGQICAVPGWSVGLVESIPVIPQPGQGNIVGGRRQLETHASPQDYLKILQSSTYAGETGRTLEDLIIEFLTHLHETNEVSNDWQDNNALWLLGHCLESGSVPYGVWNYVRWQAAGNMPPDRGNGRCGCSTTVRLLKP